MTESVDYYRVDYYLTPTSPWTYLGHERFAQIAKRHGAAVAVKPVITASSFRSRGACRWASERRSGRRTG